MHETLTTNTEIMKYNKAPQLTRKVTKTTEVSPSFLRKDLCYLERKKQNLILDSCISSNLALKEDHLNDDIRLMFQAYF